MRTLLRALLQVVGTDSSETHTKSSGAPFPFQPNLATKEGTAVPKPHHVITEGNIQASIWKNTGGAKGHYYTFSMSKSYERDGKTQYGTSFGYFDGIRVARLALEAVEWIAEAQQGSGGDEREAEEDSESRASRSSKRRSSGKRKGKRERTQADL